MRGSSDSVTTTQNTAPWAGQQPSLMQGFQGAQNYLNSPGQQYYPFSTVTPFSRETEQSLQMGANRAQAGSPLTGASQGELMKTLGGGYLGQNPMLDQMFNRGADQISAQVNSRFGGTNRTNSGAMQRTLQEGLGNFATDLYGGQYQNERANQMRGLLLSPQIAGMDYQDIDRLGQVGARREAFGEAQMQDATNRWNFDQNRDLSKLKEFMGLIQGNYGQTGSTTQPVFRNPVGSAVGGATAGLGAGLALNQLSPGMFGGANGISPFLLPLLGGSLGLLG